MSARVPSASSSAGVPVSSRPSAPPARRPTRPRACARSRSGSAGGPGSTCHRPSRAIPIGITSVVAGSSASITERAERQLISCSEERPPNSTATRRRRSLTRRSLPGRPARRIRRREAARPPRVSTSISSVVRAATASRSSTDTAATGQVDRLADADPDRSAGSQRAGPGLLPHGRRSPAHHRDDRYAGRKRQANRARLALHRKPVLARRDGPLRIDHDDLIARERLLRASPATRPGSPVPRATGICPRARSSPSGCRAPGTDPAWRGTAGAGRRARPRTRWRVGRDRTRGCTR